MGGLEPPRPKATDFELFLDAAISFINNNLKSFNTEIHGDFHV
ncbi:hypothetical protein VPUCM_2723 [Vibrio parahaemolyticus UCM-V493]|nr:hypothetical protein VPUCM_2723 [Vibrio parahaemolyticus UCM-V493]